MQVLITDSCLVNYGDDRGGLHHDAGDLPDVPKETARSLVAAGRALYTSKTDDPDRAGANTASRDMVLAAKDLAAAKAKAQKEA